MIYWESTLHARHCCVSCVLLSVWWPGGQPTSLYLPTSLAACTQLPGMASSVFRTHVPGTDPVLAEQLKPGVRSAQKPVPHAAPVGHWAHDILALSPPERERCLYWINQSDRLKGVPETSTLPS